MIKQAFQSTGALYKAPSCELLDTLPEADFCVNGSGGIDPVTDEDWGTF